MAVIQVHKGPFRPLRWRVLTWVLIDLDALVLGFVAGVFIGYRLLSPLGSNAEEGISMLLFNAVALGLLLNLVLGLTWFITGLTTWRRSEGEPVHRLIWLPAPIALVIGGLLGTQLTWNWYSGERVSDSPSLSVWSQLSEDASVFGGPGSQVMNDVALGGPGIVAVGSDGLAGEEDAAVWTSPDRTGWSRVPDQAVFGGKGAQVITAVCAGPSGLVAVGYDAARGDDDAAVWTSSDGISWSRLPRDQAIFGGAGDQIMTDVVRAGPGLVAVGSDGRQGKERAAVWTSVDGISWSRVPDIEGIFGGRGPTFMKSVDARGPWIVAVGSTHAWTLGDLAPVWTSPDGLTWTRISDPEGVFAGAWLSGVVVGAPGVVAVGQVDGDAAVWTSPADRMRWSRIPHDESLFGGPAKAVMNGVMMAGDTVVAVGGRYWPTSPLGEVWTSADATTWSLVGHTGAMAPGTMNAVAGQGPYLVAVGLAVGGQAGPDASVWVTVREPS